MTPDEGATLINRFYDEGWNANNLDVYNELVTEDFVDHQAIPGLPISALGHNRYCSVAMTTGGPDAADVYEEEVNPSNPRQYRYDGDWRDYNTGLYLVKELGRLRDANIPVCIIAGNHDAANKMTRTLRLPGNVHVLNETRPETQRLMIQGDPHPVAKYRVVGPLSNLSSFQQAFSCRSDDAMVRPATERCEVW